MRRVDTVDDVAAVLAQLRAVVLSPANQTWRELARRRPRRRRPPRRARSRPARLLQAQMLDVAADLWGDRLSADDLPAVLSIVVNMLDGARRSPPSTPTRRPPPAAPSSGPCACSPR